MDLAGDRAIAQTKMTISQRAEVEGVLVDVVCIGRFHDVIVRHEGRWVIPLRQPIYEKDRMDPVDPAPRLARTRSKWGEESLNYFRSGLTNAATEGFSRIASLVKKRGFGYRNARDYRLSFPSACRRS